MRSGHSFFARVGVAATLLTSLVAANAQLTGVITGRVVTEDGGGLANVSVNLNPFNVDQRNPGRRLSTNTDKDGNFKFTGVLPRVYSVWVNETQGYVRPLTTASERNYYRIGDNIAITLIRGGVITGRVTTAEGEPMIGAQVSPMMARDAEGNPVRQQYGGRSRTTDDRGVYRLYGLAPGTYIVAVRSNLSIQQLSPFDGDTPTYHPSSTRDTAAEVTVASGGEAAGIDIRYRGERGHIVSGKVIGGGETSQPYVSLYSVGTGYHAGWAPFDRARPRTALRSMV